MKSVLNSPIFWYPSNVFTGDDIVHYLPAKYLWHICNVKKKLFYQPVCDFTLHDEITLDFLFFPEQPQHLYFKKPAWINNFIQVNNEKEAQNLTKRYDYFVNNNRYRGANPVENNWGYAPGATSLDLYLSAYSYKAIYEENLYLDDLTLQDKYNYFLKIVHKKINPNNYPIITIQYRGNDHWKRHLPDALDRYENLLFSLLKIYPNHIFVLLGEEWRYYHHDRIKYLHYYINPKTMLKHLGEYTACLKFILAAYFCRDVKHIFVAISGFSIFLECIRPRNLTPPIPLCWEERTFSGICHCREIKERVEKKQWYCQEYEDYKTNNPNDIAFHTYTQQFMYYSRDPDLLRTYCHNYPNNLEKTLALLFQLEKKYYQKQINPIKYPALLMYAEMRKDLPLHQQFYSLMLNIAWKTPEITRNTIINIRTILGPWKRKLFRSLGIQIKTT